MPQPKAIIAPLNPADKRAPPPVKKLCVRCKERKSIIVLQTAAFCHECFQFGFEGKLRLTLEQSRLCTYLHRTEEESRLKQEEEGEEEGEQQQQDAGGPSTRDQVQTRASSIRQSAPSCYPCKGRVAIGFSGGVASRALLHVAKSRLLRSKDENSSKSGKLQEIFAIDVIYIDDSEVIEGAEDRTEEIQRIVKQEGGEEDGVFFWPLKLQDVFDDDEEVECSAEYASPRYLSKTTSPIKDKRSSLRNLFASIQPSGTAKGMLPNARSRVEDLLSLLTSHLLRRQAIRLGDSCLMTGETSSRMAIRILDSVVKGRGHKMPVEEGSIRWNGLFILRPLKEIGAKEVTLYSRGRQLESLTPQDIVAAQLLTSAEGNQEGGNGDKASMARLTESLIHLLERNVPSTVSTVNKVGDKLVFSNDSAAHNYQGEDDEDSLAKSSIAFHQVGPSVPIRLRKRQDSAESSLSKMTLSSNNKLPATTMGGIAGDRSLQGMGLGRMGSSLYFAARGMVNYHGALACPLCQMPSQRGLHAWKRGLTISSTKNEDETKLNLQQNQINLTELLCYACTMVLDTPENTNEGTTMNLPLFVLQGAMQRLKGDALLSEEDASTVSSLLNSSPSNVKLDNEEMVPTNGEKPILQKLDREQMKRHLNGYILDEEEGDVKSTATSTHFKSTQSRQRKQTDW